MSYLPEIIRTVGELGPQSLDGFADLLEPAWIEEALASSGKASLRRRKLPADQVVGLVLGMAMFADRSIHDVVQHLDLLLPGEKTISKGAIPKARDRLGPEPIKALFEKTAEAWAMSPGPGDWCGFTLYGVDSTHLRVQDSEANFKHFGKPTNQNGEGGYPQLRLATLLNLGSRLVAGVRYGPWSTSETVLARELFQQAPDNSLTIVDRGFYSYELVCTIQSGCKNRHLLARVRGNMRYQVLTTLPDGSEHVRITPHHSCRRKHPELPEKVEGRIIAYHHPGGQPGLLFTTLLDHERFPADALIALYHQRWEVEVSYDELKTDMLECRECLRSLTPERVEQELWGLMLAYNLVRREMLMVAMHAGVLPNRISFWSSFLWIRTFWLTSWQVSPGTLPRHLTDLRRNLSTLILPERRSKRRYPRQVKIKVSRYASNRRRQGAAEVDIQVAEIPR